VDDSEPRMSESDASVDKNAAPIRSAMSQGAIHSSKDLPRIGSRAGETGDAAHIGLPLPGYCRGSRQSRMPGHPLDFVRGLAARLEIYPGQNLGNDAKQDKQHPGQSDRRGQQRQRRLDQGHAVNQLQDHRPAKRQQCQRPECQAEFAKELHWPVERAVDKIKNYEIEKDSRNSTEPIIRLAMQAGVMANRQLDYPGSLPRRIDWDKAVHLTVKAHVLDHLPPVGLE